MMIVHKYTLVLSQGVLILTQIYKFITKGKNIMKIFFTIAINTILIFTSIQAFAQCVDEPGRTAHVVESDSYWTSTGHYVLVLKNVGNDRAFGRVCLEATKYSRNAYCEPARMQPGDIRKVIADRVIVPTENRWWSFVDSSKWTGDSVCYSDSGLPWNPPFMR